MLGRLASEGIAIIVISSELPEVLAIADRILVMRQGRVVGETRREEASEELSVQMMTPAVLHEASPPPAAPAQAPDVLQLGRFAPVIFSLVLMLGFSRCSSPASAPDQSVQRDAPDPDHGADRDRHDLRYPDRGDRPLGRVDLAPAAGLVAASVAKGASATASL